MRKNKILALLDMPRPVHGLSMMNQAMVHVFKTSGINTHVINTAPSYISQLYNKKIWRLFKLIHTFGCLISMFYVLSTTRYIKAYRPINGGVGQVYDLFYCMLLKCFCTEMFIHHHSFKYLRKKSMLFSCLNRILGKNTQHIVLDEIMKSLLIKQYEVKEDNILVVSNLASLTLKHKTGNGSHKKLHLGYLANCSFDKGVDTFISVCRILKQKNIQFDAKIAGPLMDTKTDFLVKTSLLELKELEYVGPLYGDEKAMFLRNIDCFVYPSRYIHEAEPLVLYEAACSGVALLVTNIGCMSSVAKQLGGYCIDESEYLPEVFVDLIIDAINKSFFTEAARLERVYTFIEKQKKDLQHLDFFLNKIRTF